MKVLILCADGAILADGWENDAEILATFDFSKKEDEEAYKELMESHDYDEFWVTLKTVKEELEKIKEGREWFGPEEEDDLDEWDDEEDLWEGLWDCYSGEESWDDWDDDDWGPEWENDEDWDDDP